MLFSNVVDVVLGVKGKIPRHDLAKNGHIIQASKSIKHFWVGTTVIRE